MDQVSLPATLSIFTLAVVVAIAFFLWRRSRVEQAKRGELGKEAIAANAPTSGGITDQVHQTEAERAAGKPIELNQTPI